MAKKFLKLIGAGTGDYGPAAQNTAVKHLAPQFGEAADTTESYDRVVGFLGKIKPGASAALKRRNSPEAAAYLQGDFASAAVKGAPNNKLRQEIKAHTVQQ